MSERRKIHVRSRKQADQIVYEEAARLGLTLDQLLRVEVIKKSPKLMACVEFFSKLTKRKGRAARTQQKRGA